MKEYSDEKILEKVISELLLNHFSEENFFVKWALSLDSKPNRAKKLANYLKRVYSPRENVRDTLTNRFFSLKIKFKLSDFFIRYLSLLTAR